MLTDTTTHTTRVVLATSAEWACVVAYWIVLLTLCLVATAATLALSRYNDSARISARMRFIHELLQEYTMHLKPKTDMPAMPAMPAAHAGHLRGPPPPAYTEPKTSPPPSGGHAA